MIRSRPVVASLFLILSATAAEADCPTPEWRGIRSPVSTVQVRHGLAAADFDADGNVDAVVMSSAPTDEALLVRRNGDGTFSAPHVLHQAPNLYDSSARDFDGDGKIDLLLKADQSLVFLPGRGDGTFGAAIESPAVEGYTMTVAELTGDAAADVALLGSVASAPDVLIVLAGNGRGSFAETRRHALAGEAQAIAAGDLDGDRLSDLVLSYFESASIDVLYGRGDATFDPPAAMHSGMFAYSVDLADAEGDGDLDILAPNWEDETISVHRNLGGRTFSSAVYALDLEALYFSNNPSSALIADVTGDGVRDLVVAAVNGQYVATLRGNGDGTFGRPSYRSAVSLPGALHATDVNRDGRVDLITNDRITGSMIALRNDCGVIGEIRFAARQPTIAPGATAKFTIQLSGYGGSANYLQIQPTGHVSIVDGTTVLATVPLVGGAAVVEIAGLSPGSHALVARYSGDAQYEPGYSSVVVQRVTTANPRRRAAGH